MANFEAFRWNIYFVKTACNELTFDLKDEPNSHFMLEFELGEISLPIGVNAKLHTSPQSEEKFLPTQTLAATMLASSQPDR